ASPTPLEQPTNLVKEQKVTPTITVLRASAVSAEKAKGDMPYGIPVPGHKGMVTSPYSPEGNYVDVSAFAPGSAVRDPYTGKIFLVTWVRMSSASQNFPHHLDVLRQRMLHPTDYELAVNYFLEEFAGDTEFVRASDCEQLPHLVAVLGHVVSKAIGRRVEIEGPLVSLLREHRFVHGNARADGRIEIGRASCRERVKMSVVGGCLNRR